jgi:hypothetical protein
VGDRCRVSSCCCLLKVVEDRLPGKAIIVVAIDNVVKGASGQAVQVGPRTSNDTPTTRFAFQKGGLSFLYILSTVKSLGFILPFPKTPSSCALTRR